ncbi:odorant receptor 131-2 [Pangasianodon hypophthalmus]|uniref:odorant receptor 131-2 n=1 Tax=Pangasianodon hypophthalmus TaxID=310915 RepID=UPI000F002D86|nr:odorant receptor 131-2 [Pangasianodon hypophthalmus]
MCTEKCNSSHHLQLVHSASIRLNVSMAITQIFVWPFIYINILMLLTFSRKQAFRTETRYILFAHTLFVDLMFLVLTDFVVILSYSYVLMPMAFCIPFCMLMETITTCTPLTITAMCVERYVAICMPLRHSAISTVSRTLTAIFIIWIISSLKSFVDVFILVITASKEYLSQYTFCHYEIMMPENWHRVMRGAVYIIHFIMVLLVELFCYVMIVISARAASIDKKSAIKGLRTVSLHMLQLTLCTVEIICPYIETLIMEKDIQLYLSVRFFNFIMFNVIARAISPLVYGLRDERFYATLLYYIRCRQNHVSSESPKCKAIIE